MRDVNSFVIKNGTLVKNDQHRHFHQSIKDNILKVQIMIPGIDPNTLHIYLLNNTIRIETHILTDFQPIYGGQKIYLRGTPLVEIEDKSLSVEYNSGVLVLELIIKKSNRI